MRKLLIWAFLCFSFTLSATTYYIDPSGSDSNNGSSTSPWKSLSYACSKATASGDIIHVNAGTYTETSQSVLAAGVSIAGDGRANTIITLTWNTSGTSPEENGALQLGSGSPNTNGNQTISNITLDGNNWNTKIAIIVLDRSNVTIHDCTIRNFDLGGINFYNSGISTHNENNTFYNSTITDCGRRGGLGAFNFKCQKNLTVHDNVFTNTGRSQGSNGNIVYNVWGYSERFVFYNNICTKPVYDGGSWNFHMEVWDVQGGYEYYGNTFNGGECAIDISSPSKDQGAIGHHKGSYSYSHYIHNNTFQYASKYPKGDNDRIAVQFEDCYINDVIVAYNHFLRTPQPITFTMGSNDGGPYNNIAINYNIFEDIGYGDGGFASCVYLRGDSPVADYRNIDFNNNVVKGGTNGSVNAAFAIFTTGQVEGLAIRNNIIENCNKAWLYTDNNFGTGHVFHLTAANNLLYNNANNNTISDPSNMIDGATSNIVNNILNSNPNYVSATDFHLLPGSPAIGKGLSISGLTADYTGTTVKNPPSIGAYESGSTASSPAIPVYQNSVMENTTPTLLQINFSIALANIVPAASAFSVSVNSVTVIPSAVAVSGSSVLLSLPSAIKYGDIITLTYTKPAANPLQSSTGGQPVTMSAKPVTNNLINSTKTGTQVTVGLTISPNHVHRIMNALLVYSGDITKLATSILPQIVRIMDTSGKLFIERTLTTGVTNFRIPLNLSSGVYIVKIIAGGLELTSQKIIVY
jgi:hypothetical protein